MRPSPEMAIHDTIEQRGGRVKHTIIPAMSFNALRYITTSVAKKRPPVSSMNRSGPWVPTAVSTILTKLPKPSGICQLIAFAAFDNTVCLPALIDLINARFDISLTGDDVVNLGKYILKTERAFTTAAGFTSVDDRLPEFFYSEKLPPQ